MQEIKILINCSHQVIYGTMIIHIPFLQTISDATINLNILLIYLLQLARVQIYL